MIATCHILAGAAIATKTQNPALGLILAFFSHYLLDFIPHCEYVKSFKNSGKKTPADLAKVAADFLFAILIILFFSKNRLLALAGGFFAIIPDLDNLFFIFPKMLNSRFFKFDSYFHPEKIHFLKHKKIPTLVRISSQIIVSVIALYFLQSP